MANDVGTQTLYQGTDHTYVFTIKNADETACVDITAFALSWMLKVDPSDSDAAAVLTKTVGSGIVVSGTFNATPSVNAQVATVSVADTDTTVLAPRVYVHELKRTDNGFETVLAYGLLDLRQGVHR